MRGVARWCIAHRRGVIVAWVAVAILGTVVAQSVGRNYVVAFSLPGTGSQRATDLLMREFPVQSGDVDTVVFHVAKGTVDSPACALGDDAAARARERSFACRPAWSARIARVVRYRSRRTG